MRFIRLFCLAVLVAATPSAAQEVPVADWPIAVGSRVRIRSPLLGDRYAFLGARYAIGSVVSATSDTLTFRADGDSTATAIIPTRRILKIEIARGTHTNKKNGALMGSLAGFFVGVTISALTHASCRDPITCHSFYRTSDLLAGGLVGGLGGAIIGAWIGRRPTETWVPVAVPRR